MRAPHFHLFRGDRPNPFLNVELVPLGFTRRWLNSSGDVGPDQPFNTSYLTVRPVVFVSTEDATDAALFDLDKFQFESGIGIKLGVEWGRHSTTKRSKLVGDINASLATARAACIAAKPIVDPLAPLSKDETETDRPSRLALRSSGDLLGECAGGELLEWLRKDGAGNWAAIVKPIWGYDGNGPRGQRCGSRSTWGVGEPEAKAPRRGHDAQGSRRAHAGKRGLFRS